MITAFGSVALPIVAAALATYSTVRCTSVSFPLGEHNSTVYVHFGRVFSRKSLMLSAESSHARCTFWALASRVYVRTYFRRVSAHTVRTYVPGVIFNGGRTWYVPNGDTLYATKLSTYAGSQQLSYYEKLTSILDFFVKLAVNIKNYTYENKRKKHLPLLLMSYSKISKLEKSHDVFGTFFS